MDLSAGEQRLCKICERESPVLAEAQVRSNIRAFSTEQFALWQCAKCLSIHARDEVDLDHYYARYPFHDAKIDWRLRVMYGNLLRRLERAGLERGHRILDYGCGGGHFVDYLRERGYDNAVGYDEFSARFARPELLEQKYDVVVSQDVLEHVLEPWALPAKFDALVEPGGLVAIGTPNASAVDLKRARDFVHVLHQPFHRHIWSRPALLSIGPRFGWQLLRFYDTMYNNTLFPFINPRFSLFYLACFDDCLDMGFEPVRLSLRLFSPVAVFWAIFGYFFAPHTDVMAIFRRPS